MEYFGKASKAGEENKKAEYKEVLELIGTGIRPEKVLENLDTKEFMDRYQKAIEDEIAKGDTLEGAEVQRKSQEKIWVITKEGYVYEVTEDKVELIGKQGENPPPNLQEGDINFKLTPSGFTNTDVTVEIIPNINIDGFELQYSTNGTSWDKYSTAITFKENGTIHARLINPLDEVGGVATKAVDKIDRQDPKQATVSFSPSSIDTETEIVATVSQSDNGVSGVNMTKCKWVYNGSSTGLGKNESSYTGGFFQENQTQIKTKITTPRNILFAYFNSR